MLALATDCEGTVINLEAFSADSGNWMPAVRALVKWKHAYGSICTYTIESMDGVILYEL